MDVSTDLACPPAPVTVDFALQRQNAEFPGTPARVRLALAIADLARAGAELAAAQEPATRLGAVIAEAARLEPEVATLQAADAARLGAWLAAGGAEPRPEPDPATIAAEERREALAADATAAWAALPAIEQAFQHCAERVRELQRRLDDAVCNAVIDAAHGFAAKYRRALAVALEHEAVLHGLRDEMLMRGNRSNAEPAAMAAAARIGELIAETRRSAAVPHNPTAARRLLAALASDPDATL